MARTIQLNRVGTWVAAAACVAIALVSYRFAIFGVQESMPFMAHHLETGRILFFAHIALAPVALACLPFQLSPGLRRNMPAVHRWLGRIYVLAIFLSGIAGFRIAFSTAADHSSAEASWPTVTLRLPHALSLKPLIFNTSSRSVCENPDSSEKCWIPSPGISA